LAEVRAQTVENTAISCHTMMMPEGVSDGHPHQDEYDGVKEVSEPLTLAERRKRLAAA